MLSKWKKAVIHIESAADSEDSYAAHDALVDGKISFEEYTNLPSTKTRDIRYQGTAIFLEDEGNHYLVTARHVIWDELLANRTYKRNLNRLHEYPGQSEQEILEGFEKERLDTIFRIIFRVPALDVIKQDQKHNSEAFLMGLSAGVPYGRPYIFSAPELDLAIISLNRSKFEQIFLTMLFNEGYEPIRITDIETGPSSEGADVFTVGYPRATAILGDRHLHSATAHWTSNEYSLPTFAFGKISMLHQDLSYFWVDMSIYPGNSGGPVIEDDKLVGIVSSQSTIGVEEYNNLRVRIPFAKIIKAESLFELLKTQQNKDRGIYSP